MVLTEISGNVRDIADIAHYHVETAEIASDDLAKKILRVTTDHGNEYGIHIPDKERLENGSCFRLGDHELLVLSVIPDEVLSITPAGIDEMGRIAHMLGNLHKPVVVKDATITLLRDPVVEETLKEQGVAYTIEKRSLDQAMHYAELGHHHHHEHGHKHRHGDGA